jgi:hypothetical protein
MNDRTKYLKRAIDERPKGGMQTGIPKITMREADAVRLLFDVYRLEERNAELESKIQEYEKNNDL